MRSSGRLIGSVAVVAGLLLAAGIASRTHPLWGHRSSFSSQTTDILIAVAGAALVVLIVAHAIDSRRPHSEMRHQWGVGRVLLTLAFLALLVFGSYRIGHTRNSGHSVPHATPCTQYARTHANTNCTPPIGRVIEVPPGKAHHTTGGGTHVPWIAVAAILAFLAGGVVVLAFVATRPRLSQGSLGDDRDLITRALDLSIDDLLRESDTRRAIIAAYARMEAALAQAGLPRHPSETPTEYLIRSLGELDASAEAASRLTELFERAKFSQHAATTSMRDEAIDAFVAVRDELSGATASTAA